MLKAGDPINVRCQPLAVQSLQWGEAVQLCGDYPYRGLTLAFARAEKSTVPAVASA